MSSVKSIQCSRTTASVKSASVKSASVKSAGVKSASVKSASVKSASVKSASVKSASVKSARTEISCASGSVTSTRSERLLSLAAKKAVLLAKKNGAKRINELQAKLQEVQIDNEIEIVEAEEEIYAQYEIQDSAESDVSEEEKVCMQRDVAESDVSKEEDVKRWISSVNDNAFVKPRDSKFDMSNCDYSVNDKHL